MSPLLFALALRLATAAPLPPAAPPPLVAAGRLIGDCPAGDGDTFTLDSAILGEQRRLFVHVPASFAQTGPSRRYPLLVVLDGEYRFSVTVSVSEALAAQGQIPEMVVVGIANTNRLRDLTPPGLSVSGSSTHEGGDRFLDFIDKELLPNIDARFRTAAPRLLDGHSSGGILATYAAATRDTFRLTLALDTPVHLGDGWLAAKLMARAAARPAPPVRYVSYEARFGWSDARWNAFVAAAPPTWTLHREHVAHETHNSMLLLATYLGLRELFLDYSMQAAPVSPTTGTLRYYDTLAAAYGGTLVPPRALIAQVVDDLLIEGRGAEAHAALDALVAAYSTQSHEAELRTRIAEVEKLPPPTETVEGLLATPFPTAEEGRAWVGDWEGGTWINDSPRNRAVLHMEIKDGRLAGTWTSWPEPDLPMEQKLEYLRVVPGGLVFGFMNGMRPRGMLLHEGRLKDGELSGTMRFGGVNVVRGPGEPPMPDFHFALRRKG
jgi:hypothetical protein